MWTALEKNHQDSSSGGRLYWIRKLVRSEMADSDIDSHIDRMAIYAAKLNSLITPSNPLTADDVHAAALLISIPDDWMHCVSGLVNEENVPSARIVTALKQESLRRRSRMDENVPSVSFAKSKGSKSASSSDRPRAPKNENDNPKPRCPLCNVDGHDLNNCNNTRRLIREHKAAQNSCSTSRSQDDSSAQSRPSAKTSARAGRTSAATISFTEVADDNESDYSGSEFEVTARNAVTTLPLCLESVASADANLD
jgi:hypothetical protein